jgi:5-methylcytosine-specific restriction endonuclease McrA
MNGQHTQRIRTKSAQRGTDPRAFVGRSESRKRRDLMRHLLRKHAGLCAICREPVSLRLGDRNYATVDHVIPVSKGGRDAPDNWQLACMPCNQAKADSP